MAQVPPGGPSTINGVLYQLLWALAEVGSIWNTLAAEADDGGQSLTTATVILEPADGGDHQVHRDGRRVVVQLKARADEGPWSLQEVVREVFPDLYRAVDLSRPDTEYRFTTEGSMGNWKKAYRFFRSLRGRDPGDDPVAALSATAQVEFAKGKPNANPKHPPSGTKNPTPSDPCSSAS